MGLFNRPAPPPPKQEIDGQYEGTDVEDVDCRLVRTTDRAALFRFSDGIDRWVPRSVISLFEEGTLTVARWFAEREGLE